MPNLATRFGSLGQWPGDPALVRVSTLAVVDNLRCFLLFSIISEFSRTGLNKRRFWPEQVNNGQKGVNYGQPASIMVKRSQLWPEVQ